MDRKSLAYSGLLLVSLVVVSLLLSRGSIQAVLNAGEVTLLTSAVPNVAGDPRTFSAELLFPDFESSTLDGVQFTISRTSPNPTTTLDIYLPVVFITSTSSSTPLPPDLLTHPSYLVKDADLMTHATGTVTGTYGFFLVEPFDDPLGTLPAGTLIGGGLKFKGVGSGAKITYEIVWTSPADAAFFGDFSAVVTVHLGQGAGFNASDPAPFTQLPVPPTFSIADAQVAEADAVALVEVTLSPPTSTSVTVTYTTADGTATLGEDYGAPAAASPIQEY